MLLKNKVAIIFGHTSGLGLEVAKNLLEKQCKVIGFARSISSLKSKLLENVQVDLLKKEDVEKATSLIKDKYSHFDYLIYCSGFLTAHNIDNLDYQELERLYGINVFAPMKIESKLLPLIKSNGADIVNITSSSLVDYYPALTEYSSSKAAFQKFTKDLQKFLKETSCRVIEFSPSGFTSNLYKNMTGDKINRDESIQMPTKDIADLLVFLLALPKKIEASYIFINRK